MVIMRPPFVIECDPPFLTVRFRELQDTLGWTLVKGGFATARDFAWLEVTNRDLTPEVDPVTFLAGRLRDRGIPDAVAFLTSRDIRRHHFSTVAVEEVQATCLTTVGLTNGERIGTRRRAGHAHAGTINTLLHSSRRLAPEAFIEAISIAAQARTVALADTDHLRKIRGHTGTGTDCIVVAAPDHGDPLSCVGLHTAAGEAMGAAVYQATKAAAEQWSADAETFVEA